MPMMRNARGGHFSMSAEDRKGAGKRLMGYVLRHHRIRIAVVIVGILLSSYATVAGSMFIKDLIDVYIEPMLLSSQPDFGPLAVRDPEDGLYLSGGYSGSFADITVPWSASPRES